MAKKNRNKGIKGKKGRYVPVLQNLQTSRESWADNAPRLTEEQKARLSELTRQTYQRLMKVNINRSNFASIHERLESEIGEKVQTEMGLLAGIEWRGRLFEKTARAMRQDGIKTGGYIEGITPTQDFVNSSIFDGIEEFQPIVVLFQFDEYDKYISSTEASVSEAEKRREQGDAYFTERDRQINYRPDVGTSDTMDDSPEEE